MLREFLSGADELAHLQWTEIGDDVKTAQAKVRGFSFLKHLYEIKLDSRNHTLTVKRLYNDDGSNAGEEVGLGFTTAAGKHHNTSQWILAVLLTSSDAINDEEKGRILAPKQHDGTPSEEQSRVAQHQRRLMTWISDRGCDGQLPKFGINSQAEPGNDPARSTRALNVYTSMLRMSQEQTLNILMGKSVDFKVAMLRHLLSRLRLNRQEKEAFFLSLLNQNAAEIESILKALAFDELTLTGGNESKHFRAAVLSLIEANPAQFAEKLGNAVFKPDMLKLIMRAVASQDTASEQIRQFYHSVCSPAKAQARSEIAEVACGANQGRLADTIINMLGHAQTGAAPGGRSAYTLSGVSTRPYEPGVDESGYVVVDLDRLLADVTPADCVKKMIEANCEFSAILTPEQYPCVIQYAEELNPRSQLKVILDIIKPGKALTDYQNQLLTQLIERQDQPNQTLCNLLCGESDPGNIWQLYFLNHQLALRVLKSQTTAVKVKCLHDVVSSERYPAQSFNRIVSNLAASADENAEINKQLCVNGDSGSFIFNLLIRWPEDAAELIKTQDAQTQSKLLCRLALKEYHVNSAAADIIRTWSAGYMAQLRVSCVDQILTPANPQFHQVCQVLTAANSFDTLVSELIELTPQTVNTILANLFADVQFKWLNVILRKKPITVEHQNCVSWLLQENSQRITLARLLFDDDNKGLIPILSEVNPQLFEKILIDQAADVQLAWLHPVLSSAKRLTANEQYCIKSLLFSDNQRLKGLRETFFKEISEHSYIKISDMNTEAALSLLISQSAETQIRFLSQSVSDSGSVSQKFKPVFCRVLQQDSQKITQAIMQLTNPNLFIRRLFINQIEETVTLLKHLPACQISSIVSELIDENILTPDNIKKVKPLLERSDINQVFPDDCAVQRIEKIITLDVELAIYVLKTVKYGIRIKVILAFLQKEELITKEIIVTERVISGRDDFRFRGQVAAALNNRQNATVIFQNIVFSSPTLAVRLYARQTPDKISELISQISLNNTFTDKAQAALAFFIGKIFHDADIKRQILQALAESSQKCNVFTTLYSVQKQLISSSLTEMPPEQQLKVMTGLLTLAEAKSNEANSILNLLCGSENKNKSALIKLITETIHVNSGQDQLSTLSMLMTLKPNSLLPDLIQEFPEFVTKIAPCVDEVCQIYILNDLKDTKRPLFAKALITICDKKEEDAVGFIDSLTLNLSPSDEEMTELYLNNFAVQEDAKALVKYLPVSVRRRILRASAKITHTQFLAFLQPLASEPRHKEDLLTDWTPAISITMCKKLLSENPSEAEIQHLSEIVSEAPTDAVCDWFKKALSHQQASVILKTLVNINRHGNQYITKAKEIVVMLTEKDIPFAVSVVINAQLTPQNQADIVVDIPPEPRLKFIKAVSDKGSHTRISPQDRLLAACVVKHGVRQTFNLANHDLALQPENDNLELMKNKMYALSKQCASVVLTSTDLSQQDKLYIINQNVFDLSHIADELYKVCQNPQQAGINNAVEFLAAIKTATLKNILICAKADQFLWFINQLTQFKLKALLSDNQPLGQFCKKLSFETVFNKLEFTNQELVGFLTRLTEQDIVLSLEWVNKLVLKTPPDELTKIFTATKPPLAAVFVSAMQENGKLACIKAGKSFSEIEGLLNKSEVKPGLQILVYLTLTTVQKSQLIDRFIDDNNDRLFKFNQEFFTTGDPISFQSLIKLSQLEPATNRVEWQRMIYSAMIKSEEAEAKAEFIISLEDIYLRFFVSCIEECLLEQIRKDLYGLSEDKLCGWLATILKADLSDCKKKLLSTANKKRLINYMISHDNCQLALKLWPADTTEFELISPENMSSVLTHLGEVSQALDSTTQATADHVATSAATPSAASVPPATNTSASAGQRGSSAGIPVSAILSTPPSAPAPTESSEQEITATRMPRQDAEQSAGRQQTSAAQRQTAAEIDRPTVSMREYGVPEAAPEQIRRNGDREENLNRVFDSINNDKLLELMRLFSNELSINEIVSALRRYFTTSGMAKYKNSHNQNLFDAAIGIVIGALVDPDARNKLKTVLEAYSESFADQEDIELFESIITKVSDRGLNSLHEELKKIPYQKVFQAPRATRWTADTLEDYFDDNFKQLTEKATRLKRLIQSDVSTAMTHYSALTVEDKTFMLSRLHQAEIRTIAAELKKTDDLLLVLKLFAERACDFKGKVRGAQVRQLNQIMKDLNDLRLTKETWTHRKQLAEHYNGIFESAEVNILFGEQQGAAQPALKKPLEQTAEVECDFEAGTFLPQAEQAMIKVPKGFTRIKIDAVGDCLFRLLLLEKSKEKKYCSTASVPTSEIRRHVTSYFGNIAEEAVCKACMSALRDTNAPFAGLAEHLCKFALFFECKEEGFNNDPVAEYIFKNVIGNDSFSYYQAQSIESLFDGVSLDSDSADSIRVFSEFMADAITEQILAKFAMSERINFMKDMNTPIWANHNTHYDLLVPNDQLSDYQ